MNEKYVELLDQIGKYDKVAMVTTLGEDIHKDVYNNGAFFEDVPEIVEKAFEKGVPVVEEVDGVKMVAEPFGKEPRLIICGGGHVSLSLGKFASMAGFSVVVIDDREQFANKERFPFAKEVVCDSFSNAFPKLGVSSIDYIAIITRGHFHDANCLRAIYKEEHTRYVGLIGARGRVAKQMDLLESEGIERAWLNSIYTPIGLNIGAKTPEEVAIAILAELIQVKYQTAAANISIASDVDIRTVEEIACPPENKKHMKRAVVTLIETFGSCPRKAGSKMIVYEDGSIGGTIGGGLGEGRMIEEAKKLIKTGGYKFEEENLTHDVAANEGMVCGGEMKMLIEVI